jgi:hypothetical protein
MIRSLLARRAVPAALVITLIVLLLQTSASARQELPLRLTAVAANLNAPAASAGVVDITIERWSTDAEREQFFNILREKGQVAARDALQRFPRVGFFRSPDSLGYPIQYAHQEPWGDGGRRVTLMTDRPIGFWEAANRPRTAEYPFTVIEIQLKSNGQGDGKVTVATKLILARSTLIIENYDMQPVRLTTVKQVK